MLVYLVMRTQRVSSNHPDSKDEQYKAHIHSAYLIEQTAKDICTKLNKIAGRHFVQPIEIRDIAEVIGTLPTGFILEPLGLKVVNPCEGCKQPCGNVACPKALKVTS